MAIKKPKSSQIPKKHHSILNKSKTKKKKTHTGKNPNFVPLGDNPLLSEMKKKQKEERMSKIKNKKNKKGENEKLKESGSDVNSSLLISTCPKENQLKYFLHCFQSKKGKLSPLELEEFKDTCMVELSPNMDQDMDNFSQHMKAAFKGTWKNELYDGKLVEGKVDAGSPAIIVISTSALRSLEFLRGLRPLTKECRPAKLFAKHLKVEEQVALLKDRVNIACGTPSRIKKLIDMDSLLLSRLKIIVLDMQRDAKGYSLFSLPQVSTQFWDLYKNDLNERLLQGQTRICFYGPVPESEMSKICE